eukprot:TRINITY_DN2966_c0_g1_i2.p1 TRINITY_DN2966_c0_g1~~TRINITY_DN2966_c0_g1_i2.p1  ORF type:complete len:941 (+),score=212.33 TRINITY_DN2966_c0_g1_i2:245-3067(+)
MLTVLRRYEIGDQQVRANVQYPIGNTRKTRFASADVLSCALREGAIAQQALKHCLNLHLDYGPELVEHAILTAGLTNGLKLTTEEDALKLLPALVAAFEDCEQVLQDAASGNHSGYIIYKDRNDDLPQSLQPDPTAQDPEVSEAAGQLYLEFVPFLLKQHVGEKHKEFPTFSMAMDEYFSKSEAQKESVKKSQMEQKAKKKLEAAKAQQHAWIEELGQDSELNVRKAQLIEYNMGEVDMAIQVIRSALANSVDWTALKRIIKTEQRKGDPIANLIFELRLETNEIVLLLSSDLDNASDDELTQEATKVAVTLSESAYGNACRYYDLKKKLAGKQNRAKEMAAQTLKKHEKHYEETIKKVAVKSTISQIRKTYWFEKFFWFISSENFLVLSGKDKQQNELLVKRYMKKDDLYVHADIHGASTVIIKNSSGKPVPPSTLKQAGEFAVCRSSAWDSKMSMGAYWVYPHQVSKTAPTGEYLTTGSFMIRGRKNFLPPVQLVMGYSFLFRIEESCLGNHVGERQARYTGEDKNSGGSAGPPDQRDDADDVYSLVSAEPEPIATAAPPKEPSPQEVPSASPGTASKASKYIAADYADDDEDDDNDGNHTSPADSEMRGRVTKEALVQHESRDESTSGANRRETLHSDDTEHDRSETASIVSSSALSSVTGRRLTAKERRDRKKAQARAQNGIAVPPPQSIEPTVGAGKKNKKKGPTQPQVTMKRGQKAKLKKMKKKYGDQDEEERALALKLLGSKAPKVVLEGGSPEDNMGDIGDRAAGKDGSTAHDNGQTSATEERHRARQAKQKHDAQTAKELQELYEEENIKELSEADKQALNELSLFTGKPLADDVLLYALPVCGPYSAIQNYKYKAKLLPGQQKRGKAANQVQRMFLQAPGVTKREKELISSCADHERMPIMPNLVSIASSSSGKGGKAAGKTGKKGGKKR